MTNDFRADVAHSARVYDYWLGGKDNFAAERDLAETIRKAVPNLPRMVRANRHCIHRAVRHLTTSEGIRQFLDIGTGIPTRPRYTERRSPTRTDESGRHERGSAANL